MLKIGIVTSPKFQSKTSRPFRILWNFLRTFLKSYGKSWPKFEQVSKKVLTSRTLKLLVCIVTPPMRNNLQTWGNATINRYFEVGTIYRRYWERNGWETARTKDLYGLDMFTKLMSHRVAHIGSHIVQSQPFSTVSLIYGEPLGSRSHFKVRGCGRVDCSFFEGCHDAFYDL